MTTPSYSNNPNSKAKTRILYDIKDIAHNYENLKNEGLYFEFCKEDTINTKYLMLIVGPDDSPYVGGYYYFDCMFPDKYPFYPMKIYSKTQGGGIRKHPNLYVNGKCCFSFLGTWSGPPWTACQNPKTAGIAMRSVLTNNPIINEPGWENKENEDTKLYENLVRYFNIRYAVIEILEKTPKELECLKDELYKTFLLNYDKFLIEIKKIIHLDQTTVNSPIYSFSVSIDCGFLQDKLIYLHDKISNYLEKNTNIDLLENNDKNEKPDNLDEKPVNSNEEIKISKSKTSKKCPDKQSSKLPIGHIEIGLDGNEYIVKETNLGKKRWVKNKK